MTSVVARKGDREISASPARIVFSGVGSPLSQDVTLTNTGTDPVQLYDVACHRDFEVVSKTCGAALAAGASCTISVQPLRYYNVEGLLVVLTSAGPLCISMGTSAACPSGPMLAFRISSPAGSKVQLLNGHQAYPGHDLHCPGSFGPLSASGSTLTEALASAVAGTNLGDCEAPPPCTENSYLIGPTVSHTVSGLNFLRAILVDQCGATLGYNDFWSYDTGYQFPQIASSPESASPYADDVTVIFQPTGHNANAAQLVDFVNPGDTTINVTALAATDQDGTADPHSAIHWSDVDGNSLALPFAVHPCAGPSLRITHTWTDSIASEGGYNNVTRYLTVTTDAPQYTDTIASVIHGTDNRSNQIVLAGGSPMPSIGQLIEHDNVDGGTVGTVTSVDASTKKVGLRYPGEAIASQPIKFGKKYQLQLIGGQWTSP